MLRGFRWQFAAFGFATVLFVIALVTRPTPQTETPSPPPPLTEAATLTPTTTASPTPTAPDATPAPVSVTSDDGISTYREALVGRVQRLNPLLRGLNPVEDDITSLIFEGLVGINEYGEPEPVLAQEWLVASNRIEYVFTLRDDILWQDGTPFTARDVAFTMALLRSPDFPGNPEVGAFWRTVETEVLGEHLVRFRLTQPLGSFLDALRIGILPEHALRGITADQLTNHPFNLTPVGTGPYQLEAIRTDGERISAVDLRPAAVYQQRPEAADGYGFQRVRFRVYPTFDAALNALRTGDVDGLAAPNAENRVSLLGIENTQQFTKIEPTLGTLIFNWRRPDGEDAPPNPFREERIRAALANAVNREPIIQRNLLNVAVQANNPLLPGSWAFASDLVFPDYNPEQAAFLLETANLTEITPEPPAEGEATPENPPTAVPEGEGILLRFSILTPDTPALVGVAQEMANQWSSLPIDVTVEAVAPNVYRQRLESGDFDTALVELSLGNSADPDVYSFWHQGQYPDGDNYGAVDDRRISETLERARRDPSGINRIEHYRQFQAAFINRVVAIPLYYPLYTYVVSERVDGVQLGFVGEPSDRLRNIREWRPVN